MKQRKKNLLRAWLYKKLGGNTISFKFIGDKGKDQIHLSSFTHYNEFKDEFVIDWTNKTITLVTRKSITRSF